MKWILDNWYIVVGFLGIGIFIGVSIVKFFNLPTDQQIAKVKEWLKWAVTQAEKELGSGTGQLKLRYVYDLFVKQYPDIAVIISFDAFSDYVSEALEWLNNQLETNPNLKNIVEGGGTNA